MCRLPFMAVVAALALILACGGAAEHSTESEAMKKSLSMDHSPMDQPGDFFSGGEDARTVIVEKEVMQEVVSEQVSEGRKGARQRCLQRVRATPSNRGPEGDLDSLRIPGGGGSPGGGRPRAHHRGERRRFR